MRTFIAIPFPKEIRNLLELLQAQLKTKLGSNVSWTNPESIHLTLKFLGEVPEKQIADISNRLITICRLTSSMEVLCGGLGCFPNSQNPKVIWMGILVDKHMKELHSKLDEACETLGFPKEDRPFSPHLTLGRVKVNLTGEQLEYLNKSIENENRKKKIPVVINQVNLYKSELQRNGAKYTILKEAPLLPESSS